MPEAPQSAPFRVAPIVTMAVQEHGGCGTPIGTTHVCIADRGHPGGCCEGVPVEDIDVDDQITIEALRSALRTARDFIVGHPAVRGEWPMLVRSIDDALSYKGRVRG